MTAVDFVVLQEEEGSEEQQDGATAGGGADPSNGEAGAENGTPENAEGQKTAGEGGEGQDGGKEEGDEQEEEDELEVGAEEACEGSDGSKEKRSGISKYFTVSYRKIKKGIAKQRVDEFEQEAELDPGLGKESGQEVSPDETL
ncbi:hypothetical protein HF521_000096 [Silurus meridionalis]|uniref:Uncharacterized protein n=1 Tax=Silurus meridionalis TaxID=175797 RepID=A0A8T0BW55_SILME|nr:hypothetical protein HF521_000096 [Silurus meridionalis]